MNSKPSRRSSSKGGKNAASGEIADGNQRGIPRGVLNALLFLLQYARLASIPMTVLHDVAPAYLFDAIQMDPPTTTVL